MKIVIIDNTSIGFESSLWTVYRSLIVQLHPWSRLLSSNFRFSTYSLFRRSTGLVERIAPNNWQKYNRDYPLQEAMRQEHVSLQIEQISELYDLIKKYLQELKMEVIHEEKYENYWSIKAHKGGKGSVIIGNIREVEVMISGAGSNYDLLLRTGAWGRDIIVPAAIASVFSLGVGAAVAGVEAYRAHSFEKHFWENINKMISEIGQGKATMSSPVAMTP